MILCDVGNTAAKFYENGKLEYMSISDFKNFQPTQKVFFVNVNKDLEEKLKNNTFFYDLKPFFNIKTNYIGLGIDRIAVCCHVDDGIIVDVGTAITVDVISNKVHEGGFILPGISSFLEAYSRISPILKVPFNLDTNLDILPQKTSDAILYGMMNSVILSIKNIAKNKKIFLTGGNGHIFSKFFDNSVYDKILIFKSMLKIIDTKKELIL